MMKKIAALLFMSTILIAADAQLTMPLYTTIPNSKPGINKETSDSSRGLLIIRNVSVPTITMYTPVVPIKNGTAVIICPGGGYGVLAASHEGSDVARVFNSWGITAFVLKYRLPDDVIMTDKSIAPLQDAQRALQMVREHAKEWNIDPHKVGIMGFSAGGHLAATASTHYTKSVIDNPAKISLRPDFSLLIYPVISFADSLTHQGSKDNLLGTQPAAQKVISYSNELQVNKRTPPAYLVHAKDDDGVKVENSLLYYKALQKYKVPAEIKLYEKGGHGFGMNNSTSNEKWMDGLKEWLHKRKFLL